MDHDLAQSATAEEEPGRDQTRKVSGGTLRPGNSRYFVAMVQAATIQGHIPSG
jgi:hypothetical protein